MLCTVSSTRTTGAAKQGVVMEMQSETNLLPELLVLAQLVDRHRVIESSYPPNMGTGYIGEELSATFNIPVDCDKDNGNYWFDVRMEQSGNEIPSTFYTVFCEERTIYMKPTGVGVSSS